MAKDTFYFSHDYNARNDEKILELRVVFGAEGYGVFWMIVENMAENENGGLNTNLMGGLSLSYGLPIGKLREFITFCISIDLFYEEGTFLFSKRLKKHKELRLKLVETGKESANKRWKNGLPTNNPLTTHLVPNGLSMQRKGKERKGN